MTKTDEFQLDMVLREWNLSQEFSYCPADELKMLKDRLIRFINHLEVERQLETNDSFGG
jgi:hypothetical protein